MNKQLLKGMLAGAAALVASNAFAAGSVDSIAAGFKLTIDWEQATDWASTTGRFATAVKGSDEVLVMNNVDKHIWAFNKDGKSIKMGIGAGVASIAITCDQAGNIIYQSGWPGATCGHNLVIRAANDTATAIDVAITLPDGVKAGRVDQFGRVVGDVTSAEGAYIYLPMASALDDQNTQYAYMVAKIVENAADEVSMSTVLPGTLSTSVVAQPLFNTVEEIEGCNDPTATAVCYTQNGSIWTPNEDFDAWVTVSRKSKPTGIGFDLFKLGEETYYVYGGNETGSQWNNSNGLMIVRASDNAVVATYLPEKLAAGQNFGSIMAYANEEGTAAEIYRWSSLSGAAKLTFALNSDQSGVEEIAAEANAPAEYYNLQGIRVAQPEAGKLYIVKQGDKVSKIVK